MFSEYVSHGWRLVGFEPGLKGPRANGWQLRENAITHPLAAEKLKAAGLMHAYSGTCAIDIDDYGTAKAWLAERGIDLDALLSAPDAVQIKSPAANRGKLLYALDTPLPTKKLAEYETPQGRRMALELRCGTRDGSTMQDVLPPSPHPDPDGDYIDGYYEWAGSGDWRELPPLPDALKRLWESYTQERTETSPEPTIDRGRIKALLDSLDPDMVRDDWYKAGMAVHHEFGGSEEGFQLWHEWSSYGQKYAGERDCHTVWNSFEPGGGITGQSLVQMADMSVAASDFPVVNVQQAEPNEAKRLSLWTARDMLQPYDAPPFLVDGLLEHGAEASLIGPSKSFKSLWALELGVRVATGTEFFDRPTCKGLVMYLCGEGAGGLRHRLQALKYARELDFADAPFVVLPQPLALPTGDGVALVRNLIAQAETEYGQKLALLIIDTFGRYSAGEENVAEDLYKFFRAAGACRGDAALLVVHHTGHNDPGRGRGTSAWEQAVDTEFVAGIKEDTGTRVFENTKQKDGEPATPQFFTLARQRTDSTRVGAPVESVVLEPTVQESTGDVKLSPGQQILHDIVERLSGELTETIREEYIKTFPKPAGKDRRGENHDRDLKALLSKRLVRVEDDRIHLAGAGLPGGDFSDLIGARDE